MNASDLLVVISFLLSHCYELLGIDVFLYSFDGLLLFATTDDTIIHIVGCLLVDVVEERQQL